MAKDDKPKISYEECDQLVRNYRDHDSQDSAELLIDAFEGYLVKFFNVIRWGKMNIQDRTLREFVKLYMPNEHDRRHVHQYKHMPTIQSAIYRTTENIRSLCEPYDWDELWNEVVAAFLTMAKRYQSRDDKPRFHTYILQAFHYQLRRQLQSLVADPIIFRMATNLRFNDNYMETDDNTMDVQNFYDTSDQFTVDRRFNTVNDNWVLGHTVTEEYRQFTVMERKIIKMYYIDNLSDQEIANQLGTCRATVNRRRNKAVNQLEEHYKAQKRVKE